MSRCAEPGTFELEVLIEENEDFGTAFEKTRSRVLKALLTDIKRRFGYSPGVSRTRLLKDFFCENTIDWASDVLGAKKSGLDWKRPHKPGETGDAEKCGRRLNKNGFAIRVLINLMDRIHIFLVPVLLCPDCQERRALDEAFSAQYCQRILPEPMVKRHQYASEVYEALISEGFDKKYGEVEVYFSEEQAEAVKQDFQKMVGHVKARLSGPLSERVIPQDMRPGPRRGEKPSRKDRRQRRLEEMVVWVKEQVRRPDEQEPVKNWYSRLRRLCSDENGDPCW
ncbi:hypothetical protein [Eubacterium sp. 1001713B170207_170306_E7]|uniref:hypothetical protein n=1 Tax=Eubacterium sp. 1001713B170207_170306_E7 TaxID=2787097 RepID=UPI00189836CC|nr:hypothetical protein [Eubacterium sp. 1001713B170207_170306_E7]